ncbi:MAG: methyltransferase domain-containing protein [Candidatus Poribacteria bacterium]|nr:methyltransferase domain-containing protein [Candidatus Poribacteria bacterium]
MIETSMPETSSSIRQRMREFYETSETYKNLLAAHDEAYLRHYVELVIRHAPPRSKILDIGCGNGISARLLNQADFDVVGTDISSLFLKEAQNWENPRLRYQVCDVMELPFESESFAVICSNELVEHLPDVETALNEMIRVVCKGGRIVISGPNLCSPLIPLLDWLNLMSGKSGRPVWGETKRQALQQFARNCRLYVQKRFLTKTPHFIYREPDLQANAIGGDADSAYYASPIDLAQFFRSHGFTIIKKAVGFGIKGRIIAGAFPYLSPYITMVVEK